MKKFEVTIKETVYGVMEIKAKSQKEAEDKAYELWSDGKFPCGGSIDMDIIGTKEI